MMEDVMDLEFKSEDGTAHGFSLDSGGGQTFQLTLGDTSISGSWLRSGPNSISLLTDDGRSHLVHLARDDSGLFHIHHRGLTYSLIDAGADTEGTGGGGSADTGGDINDKGEILSPMPGKIVDIPVAVGDHVSAGDLLIILESMKMENPVLSPVDGTVINVPLEVGSAAALGEPLIQLEVEAKED
jgi:acetyl/propionyl-CoA carboxylase alpha subunit